MMQRNALRSVSNLLAAILLGGLAGCTGTEEERLPTILIIGSAPSAGGGQLQLVEDVFDPAATPARDLVPLPGSERPLPAPPVSMDLTDRDASRSQLVVLAVEEDGSEAYLVSYGVAEIDPENLTSTFVRSGVLNLGPLFAGSPIEGDLSCLVEVQVTSGGEYAALLSDGSCTSGGDPDVHIIDTGAETLTVSLTNEYSEAFGLLDAGIFIDQDDDTLWFLADSIGDTSLYSLDLPATDNPEQVETADVDMGTGGSIGFAPVLGGFALLADGDLAVVIPQASEEAPLLETLDAATTVMPDPSGALEQLVALDPDTAALHESLEDDDPATFALASILVDITLEPVQRFAYVLEEDGVEIFDLFPYADPPSDRLEFRELSELNAPRVITWVFAGGVENSLP